MSDFGGGRPYYIAATGTLTIGGTDSAARLNTITVNTGAVSAVLTVYDGTAAAGRKFAVIDASASKSLNFGGAICKDGITAVMSGGNADVTVNAG
jgi:hypothetical protein